MTEGQVEPKTIIVRGEEQLYHAVEYVSQIEPDADKPLEVVVREHDPRRSLSQNGYWWRCMEILGGHLGYEKGEMHEIALECFAIEHGHKVSTVLPNGQVAEYADPKQSPRSSRMTRKQFSELFEWLFRWSAMEHGCRLPTPEWRE